MRKSIKIALGAVGVVIIAAVAAGYFVVKSDSFQEGYKKSFDASFEASFRSSCVTSSNSALQQKGIDPAANGMGEKIANYCSCAMEHAETKISSDKRMPTMAEMRDITASCKQHLGM
jgi:hypothetical protein